MCNLAKRVFNGIGTLLTVGVNFSLPEWPEFLLITVAHQSLEPALQDYDVKTVLRCMEGSQKSEPLWHLTNMTTSAELQSKTEYNNERKKKSIKDRFQRVMLVVPPHSTGLL